MSQDVFEYVCVLHGWRTSLLNIHWDARNMSQHKLCDDISDDLKEFEDQIAEVEQSINGNLALNKLRETEYEVKDFESFIEDVIEGTTEFYHSLSNKGDEYIGMRSDCESFLSKMQRNLYLCRFTVKEDFKRKFVNDLKESMYKNIDKHDSVDKFSGRRPKSAQARINQIYRLLKRYGLQSKMYSDDHWQAIDDYRKAISSFGCEVVFWAENGGYTDYDPSDNMPRSKEYKCRITFEDGMVIEGYAKMMAAGTVEDPFSRYDTALILWPKAKRGLGENQIRLSESEMKQALNESVTEALRIILENSKRQRK